MTFIKLTVFALLMVFLSACASVNKNFSNTQDSLVEGDNLSTSEIASLKQSGHKGNVAACYKLYIYYAFTRYDAVKCRYWLRKAAELGYPMAEYNLAVYLSTSHDEADNAEARIWYEKAATHGINKP